MLHAAQNRIDHLLERPRERRSFPASGVTPDAQSVQGGRQTRQANAIVIRHVAIGSDRLTPPQDQMIAMDPDVQTRGALMRTQQACELRFGDSHVRSHRGSLSHQREPFGKWTYRSTMARIFSW